MDRLYYQTLTIPAGTAISAAVSQSWPLEDNQLKEVTIEVPDGHCGLTGVRIMQAQQQIVPFANDSYLIANDRTFRYPFADQITSTGLVINGYNTDIFQHTFYCTALVTNLPEPGENPEAEVVAPGSQESTDLTDEDDLDINSILDTGEMQAITETTPPPTPVTTPVPVTTPPPATPPKKPVKGPVKAKIKVVRK